MFPVGSRSLLKLSQPGSYWQAWKILASLENTGGGTGGYSLLRISAGQRRYRGLFCRKNNGIEPDGNI